MRGHTDGCDEFRALASSWLDGELDELESARLERHFGVCTPCLVWTRDAAALARLLEESQRVPPTWSSEGLTPTLRRRFVRATSVGAAAVSAAAVAAFVLAQPGSGLSLFGSGSARAALETPCASCTKKEALTASVRPSLRIRAAAAPTHTHVTNPFVEQ